VENGGDRVTWTYDNTNQLTREQRSGTNAYDITYTYDVVGNQPTKLTGGVTTTSTYDAAGTLTTYSYDAVGNRSTMTDPDSGTNTYTYDDRNALSTLVNPSSETSTHQYDSVGRITTLTHANDSVATHAYDAAGRMTGLTNKRSGGTVISSFAYTFDLAGNPTSCVENGGDRVTWTYDDTNQLAREQRSGGNAYGITYTYDSVGNRLTKETGGAIATSTYDAANELTVADEGGTLTTYSYDENGNTTVINADGTLTTMTWTYEDEMATVETVADGITTMTYAGDHMRRQREDSSGTTKYLWDNVQVLMELDGNDATVARYTLAPFGFGDLISQRRGNATSFYHYDMLGSTRELTDANEDVTDTYLYDAWGNLLAETGSTTNPWQYIGKLGYLREAVIDGYLLRRRYYVSDVGRFVSRDPSRRREPTLYGYAWNLPSLLADPSGLDALDCFKECRKDLLCTTHWTVKAICKLAKILCKSGAAPACPIAAACKAGNLAKQGIALGFCYWFCDIQPHACSGSCASPCGALDCGTQCPTFNSGLMCCTRGGDWSDLARHLCISKVCKDNPEEAQDWPDICDRV